MSNAKGRILRDTTPEAKALGGWYAEIVEQSPRGELVHSTDYKRTHEGAMIAGLGLAFRLGLTLGEIKES